MSNEIEKLNGYEVVFKWFPDKDIYKKELESFEVIREYVVVKNEKVKSGIQVWEKPLDDMPYTTTGHISIHLMAQLVRELNKK